MAEPSVASPLGATLGIIGGTFNPIHVAHLRSAEEVREALGLERIVFIPSARPPHKASELSDPIAPPELRLAWARAATADHPDFEVDAVEVERPGRSFLVDTLRGFEQQLRAERPVFITGLDAFVEIGGWREPRTLFTLAHFAVTLRPPVLPGALGDWLPECVREDFEVAPDGRSARHRSADTQVRVVEITALDVSASNIRARLREGRSVRYLVPESIRRDVEKSGAYGPGTPPFEK